VGGAGLAGGADAVPRRAAAVLSAALRAVPVGTDEAVHGAVPAARAAVGVLVAGDAGAVLADAAVGAVAGPGPGVRHVGPGIRRLRHVRTRKVRLGPIVGDLDDVLRRRRRIARLRRVLRWRDGVGLSDVGL